MSESILTIIIVAIISLGVFDFIKLVCKPIKTVTVILLVIPTAATCGIALLVYKFFRNTFEVSSYSVKSFSSNPSPITLYDESSHTEVKKSKNKKPTSSFTDVSRNTTYYDEEVALLVHQYLMDLVKLHFMMKQAIMPVKVKKTEQAVLHIQTKMKYNL